MSEPGFWEKLVAFLEDIVFYSDDEYKRKAAYQLLKDIPLQRKASEEAK